MAYKLTYFDLPGRAEPIRFLFSYGNIPFEDVRINKADWAALKPNTPYGVLPILEHNGKVLTESVGMARYVAKLVKLAGNNPWEDAEIDAAVGAFVDLSAKVYPAIFISDEAKKAAEIEKQLKESVPFYFERLNKAATKEGLVLGRLTWADIQFACGTEFFKVLFKTDILSPYPNLAAIYQKVFTTPSIKAYADTHARPTLFG